MTTKNLEDELSPCLPSPSSFIYLLVCNIANCSCISFVIVCVSLPIIVQRVLFQIIISLEGWTMYVSFAPANKQNGSLSAH